MLKMTPVYHNIALRAGGSHYPGVGGERLEQFGRMVAQRCAELADSESAERIAQEFELDMDLKNEQAQT